MATQTSIQTDQAPIRDDAASRAAQPTVFSPRKAAWRFRALFAGPRLRSSWRRSETYGPFRWRGGFGGPLLSEDFS